MITDKIGQEIIVGSIIAYAISEGQSPGLRIGKVVKLKVKPNLYKPDINDYWINVYGTDKTWFEDYKLELMDRVSVIHFPDRVVVLNPDSLSEEYRKLLDKVKV